MAKEVLRQVIPLVGAGCSHGCAEALKSAVITSPGAFPSKTRKRLGLLLDKYFPGTRKGSRRG